MTEAQFWKKFFEDNVPRGCNCPFFDECSKDAEENDATCAQYLMDRFYKWKGETDNDNL